MAAWIVAAAVLFGLWLGVTAIAMSGDGTTALGVAIFQAMCFVLACGSSCMFLLALFLRFGNQRIAMLEPFGENAYGMYLVHYVFVTWLQYLLLGIAIFALAKGLMVFAATLVLSWAATVAIRRIPAAARLIGTAGGGSDRGRAGARVTPRTP